MKRSWLILAALMVFAVISCAGGNATVKEPDPLEPARKELHKGIAWYQKGCYHNALPHLCLLYTSDAADESSRV